MTTVKLILLVRIEEGKMQEFSDAVDDLLKADCVTYMIDQSIEEVT